MRWRLGWALMALLVVIIAWDRFALDGRDVRTRPDSEGPPADGVGGVQSPSGAGILQLKPTPRGTDGGAVGSLAELEAAEERGDFLGTMTPEQAWLSISQIRAEPLPPAVLNHLVTILPRLASERDRIWAAAILYRYGRKEGIEYLRRVVKANPGSPAVIEAATVLAMARDLESLDVLRGSMASFIGSEFGNAIGQWAHPMLLDRARTLLKEGTVPSGYLLMILATAGAKDAGPGLLALGIPETGVGPRDTLFNAALARVGVREAKPAMEGLRQYLDKGQLSAGWWSESARLLGSDATLPLVQQAIENYVTSRQAFGEAYESHAQGVREGTRSISQLPSYPKDAEIRLLEALDLVRDWNATSTVDPLLRALAVSDHGVSIISLNRELIRTILHLEPRQGAARLGQLGFGDDELAIAAQLNQLKPLPYLLRPRQMKVSSSRRTSP